MMELSLNYPQHADEALMQLIAERDVDALSAIYERHAQTIYNMIMRIVREPASADEILQDTFWQVWRKASEFQGNGAAAAWLYRIARNKSLDHLRRQKARPQSLMRLAGDEHDRLAVLPAAGADVEQIQAQALQRQDLRQALASIPYEQRICLEMAYFEGLSQREIAEQTNTPVGTVKTRMRMGLEKLERLMRAAGYQPEDIEP